MSVARVPPDAADSSDTRERILDAAAKVLSRRGYAGTRLAEIADLASIQAPSLYYYFDSRDDLVREVMRVGAARTREYVVSSVRALPPTATALERIARAIDAHLRVILTMSDYATAATRNAGQVPGPIRREQLEEQKLYGDFWRQLLTDARAAGQIRADLDIHAARMFIFGALSWAPEWWDSERGSIDEAIVTATRLLLGGLVSDGQRSETAQ